MNRTSSKFANRHIDRKERNRVDQPGEKKQPDATETKTLDPARRKAATRVRSADDNIRVTRFRKQPDATAEKPAATAGKSEQNKVPPVHMQRRNANETLKPARRNVPDRTAPVQRQGTQPVQSAAVLLPDLIRQIEADSPVSLTLSPPEQEVGRMDEPSLEKRTNPPTMRGLVDVYTPKTKAKKINLSQRNNKFRSFPDEPNSVSPMPASERLDESTRTGDKKVKAPKVKLKRFASASKLFAKIKPGKQARAEHSGSTDRPLKLEIKSARTPTTRFKKLGKGSEQTGTRAEALTVKGNYLASASSAWVGLPKEEFLDGRFVKLNECEQMIRIYAAPKYAHLRDDIDSRFARVQVNEVTSFLKELAKLSPTKLPNQEFAQSIYDTYIAEGSLNQLNLEGPVRLEAQKLVEGDPYQPQTFYDFLMRKANKGKPSLLHNLSASAREHYMDFSYDHIALQPEGVESAPAFPERFSDHDGYFAFIADTLSGKHGEQRAAMLRDFLENSAYINELTTYFDKLDQLKNEQADIGFDMLAAESVHKTWVSSPGRTGTLQLNISDEMAKEADDALESGADAYSKFLTQKLNPYLGGLLTAVYDNFLRHIEQ